MLAVGALFLALLAVALLQTGSLTHVELFTVMSALLLVTSGAITGLRYVQHQMPNSVMLLIGIGSASGLLLQLFSVDLRLALVAATLPILANGWYRLRWALRS
jgi:hypothetical protein